MRGILLAGGTGSRLYPLTEVTNKHLLPVGREPMLFHPLRKLINAGIHEIMVITGVEHIGDIVGTLKSGRQFDAEFTYRVQEEAGGIAQALGLCEKFAAGEKCAVILGDNIFQDEFGEHVKDFEAMDEGAMLFLKKVMDPQRFGVAHIDGDGRVLGIEEKPKEPKSEYAVTGIYFYDPVCFDVIRNLRPSARGELEITDVNNHYIRGRKMVSRILKGWWTDAGTFESLTQASRLVLQEAG
ncbi:MAG: NTP transferase domain-containing protein [Deltaproteobacteria bacterium]|nr:NTP transferase domain-containing protein [Deltaproteobacteria bacterium]MBW2308435.1 NTP transferase domain-containing protein [Deltaproteobacteria bacterium]